MSFDLATFDLPAVDLPADTFLDPVADAAHEMGDGVDGVDPVYATVGYDPADGIEDLLAGGFDATDAYDSFAAESGPFDLS